MRYWPNNMRAVVLLISVSLLIPSCAFVSLQNWFDQEGVVQYRGNKKPVPDAHVAAVWRGENSENDNAVECYHVFVTKTDKEGKFLVRGWREYFKYGHLKKKRMYIVVYKPSYWNTELLQNAPTERSYTYFLETVSDKNGQLSSKNRLKYLQKLVGATSCDLQSEDRIQLRPLYKDILKEGKRVASTDFDKKVLASITTWTEFVSPEAPPKPKKPAINNNKKKPVDKKTAKKKKSEESTPKFIRIKP